MDTQSILREKISQFLSPKIIWFLGGMILANLAGNMYRMYLPIYILNQLGATVEQVGMVFTLASLLPLFLQVIGGWISDSIGRLTAIAIGSVGGIVGYFLMIMASTWQMMLVAIAIESFSQVMVAPSFGPFLADQSTPRIRGKLYGIATTLFTVVAVIGPPLGGFIANTYNIRTLLWIGAIPYTMSFLLRLGMGIIEYKNRRLKGELKITSLKTELKKLLKISKLGRLIVWLIITAGVVDILTKLSRELMPLFMEDVAKLNTQQIGIASAMFGIATMLFAIIAGSFSDRFGERKIISFGLVFSAIGLLIFVSSSNMLVFSLSWFVFGIGNAMSGPPFSSLVSKIVPKQHYGLAFGLFWTLRGLISFPSSWIATTLWSGFNPQTPFLIFISLALLFSIFSWKKLNVKKEVLEI